MTHHSKTYGIHHITAVASAAAENLAFYRDILGLRLVKKTVNFDDPYTYHLYYGDGQGAPGTLLTFFPWENLPQGKPGAGMVTSVAFGIPVRSVDFWIDRLRRNGRTLKTEERFEKPVIQLTDPDGLPLELIGMENPPPTAAWSESPIDAALGITGFHSASATLRSLKEIRHFLTEMMGMTLQDSEKNRFRFRTDSRTGPGRFFDVRVDPTAPKGNGGTGTVHHIAFRAENDADQAAWRNRLRQSGLEVTAVRDRKYFRSIYFHSPGGILFEIATDPPGFEVDEPASELGKGLKLPKQYEGMRGEIENRLPALA